MWSDHQTSNTAHTDMWSDFLRGLNWLLEPSQKRKNAKSHGNKVAKKWIVSCRSKWNDNIYVHIPILIYRISTCMYVCFYICTRIYSYIYVLFCIYLMRTCMKETRDRFVRTYVENRKEWRDCGDGGMGGGLWRGKGGGKKMFLYICIAYVSHKYIYEKKQEIDA